MKKETLIVNTKYIEAIQSDNINIGDNIIAPVLRIRLNSGAIINHSVMDQLIIRGEGSKGWGELINTLLK